MREHAPQAQLAVRDPRDVRLERVVEGEPPLLAERHHGNGCEELGDRADAVLALDGRLDPGLAVGEPHGVRPDDAPLPDDSRGE